MFIFDILPEGGTSVPIYWSLSNHRQQFSVLNVPTENVWTMSRDPYPFPKYENDENFAGIKQCQKLTCAKPTHIAQNEEPWSSLNDRATSSSMRRNVLYRDQQAQKDSLDLHLSSVYDNSFDYSKHKNEIVFQRETLQTDHREDDDAKTDVRTREIRTWVDPQKASIHSIEGVIESHHNASTNRGYSRKHDGGFY